MEHHLIGSLGLLPGSTAVEGRPALRRTRGRTALWPDAVCGSSRRSFGSHLVHYACLVLCEPFPVG